MSIAITTTAIASTAIGAAIGFYHGKEYQKITQNFNCIRCLLKEHQEPEEKPLPISRLLEEVKKVKGNLLRFDYQGDRFEIKMIKKEDTE